MARKRKKFGEDDLAIWRRVQSTVTPLPYLKPNAEPEIETPNLPVKTPRHERTRISHQAITSHKKLKHPIPIPSQNLEGLHRKQRRAVKKGDMDADAVLDLHGLRLEAARSQLERFITDASRNRYRVVLVITGKGGFGRKSDFGVEMSGVIRRSFPEWMREPLIARHVHHFTNAHIKHGGEGAWYVFLRSKKSG